MQQRVAKKQPPIRGRRSNVVDLTDRLVVHPRYAAQHPGDTLGLMATDLPKLSPGDRAWLSRWMAARVSQPRP